MKNKTQLIRQLLGCWLWLLTSSSAWASHIIGGNIALSTMALREGESTLSMQLIFDEFSPGTVQNSVVVSVFRKSDNLRMADFTLQRELFQPIPYANAGCINMPLAKVVVVKYSAFVALPPTTYDAPEGYYVVWEQCCRNGAVVNLQNARNTGLVFYLEIPPTTIKNNSPAFKTPDVKYACRGLEFELDFGALDFDNDELQYSFVTPLAGFTDAGNAIPARSQRGPYPRARWAAGFDSLRAVPNANGMTINAQTGKINFQPTQLGRFVISVRCEEIRAGKKMGETRRDYEVIVIDCPKLTPPPVLIELKTAPQSAVIERQNGSITAVSLCRGDSVSLRANDENPQWAYQWQLDGKDIMNQNRVSATFGQPGNYSVVKRFAKPCGTENTATASVQVVFKNSTNIKLISSKKMPLCSNDSTNLSIESNSRDLAVTWTRDGRILSNTGPVLPSIRQAGFYKATATDRPSGCTSRDSLLVKIAPPPSVNIVAVGNPTFCANDSTKLIATQSKAYDYVWFLGDMPLVQAVGYQWKPTKSGEYSVVITDTTTRCAARSNTIEILIKPAPTAVLDSIPPICGLGVQAVSLNGSPQGGTYTGRGVVGQRFITVNLTPGVYPVVYSVTNAVGCTSSARRNAIISTPPRLQTPRQLIILKGEGVVIKTNIPANSSVEWLPATGLDDARSERPTASPTSTTIYKMRVQTPEGCVVELSVEVVVIELKIPNGFTPNADGANDTWELEGIRNYPNCTVEIVNRWGNMVFKTQGYFDEWDGQHNGEPLPVGEYYYVVHLRELDYKLTGNVSIIR
ncbi:MAG: gliding motility-associated C-terminal domain-containing protein [Runella slithyformis]|nr:MAG: gliding motility-associated C-terminal domain-containing protein [Runella slithyformis]